MYILHREYKPYFHEKGMIYMVKLRKGKPNAAIAPGINLLPGTNITDDASIVYVRAATLGFVTGLRSMTSFALLSWLQGDNDSKSKDPVEAFLDYPAVRLITALLALGELVGDKLPIIPSRLSPGPLFGRLVIGALAGMSICHQARQSLILGALLGAAGAGAGSFAGYYGRTTLAKATRIPQWLWGIAEDWLAVYLGSLAVGSAAANSGR
jgi:uncharacterized membrane protein